MSDTADTSGASIEAPTPPAEVVPVVEAPTAPEPVPEIEIEAAPAQPEPLTPAPEPTPDKAAVSSAATTVPIRDRLNQAFEALRFRKRAKLDKILALAAKKKSIKNDDVEKLLHVSDATAPAATSPRLVKEGKLKHSGPPGHAIYESA